MLQGDGAPEVSQLTPKSDWVALDMLLFAKGGWVSCKYGSQLKAILSSEHQYLNHILQAPTTHYD